MNGGLPPACVRHCDGGYHELRVSHSNAAARELERLRHEFPLAPQWGTPEVFVETSEIAGVSFYLSGLVASVTAEKTATGSAASVAGHDLGRAYFELVERACLLDAIDAPVPSRVLLDVHGNRLGICDRAVAFPTSAKGSPWAYARSNGVAAGPDWVGACAAAEAEARERHCVLSAWYGFSAPARRKLENETLRKLASVYDFEAYLFPAPEGDGSAPSLSVIGCFGFPKTSEAPFLAGFGAAATVHAAEERAVRETLQRLGFLWGEAIPDSEPEVQRNADYHQELYLWPPKQRTVRAWLGGTHVGRFGSFPQAARGSAGFVDITPEHLGGRLRVAKMVSGGGLALTFGLGHPHVAGAAVLGAHPIA